MLAWSLWCWGLLRALKSITSCLLIGHQRGLVILWLHKPDISSKFTSHLPVRHPPASLSPAVFELRSEDEFGAKKAWRRAQPTQPQVISILSFYSLWHWQHWSNLLSEALLILPICPLGRSFMVADVCDGTLDEREMLKTTASGNHRHYVQKWIVCAVTSAGTLVLFSLLPSSYLSSFLPSFILSLPDTLPELAPRSFLTGRSVASRRGPDWPFKPSQFIICTVKAPRAIVWPAVSFPQRPCDSLTDSQLERGGMGKSDETPLLWSWVCLVLCK